MNLSNLFKNSTSLTEAMANPAFMTALTAEYNKAHKPPKQNTLTIEDVLKTFKPLFQFVEVKGGKAIASNYDITFIAPTTVPEGFYGAIEPLRQKLPVLAAQNRTSEKPTTSIPNIGDSIAQVSFKTENLKQTIKSVAKEKIRYYLNGVCFDSDKMAATNGHHLTFNPATTTLKENIIIPTEACNWLLKYNVTEFDVYTKHIVFSIQNFKVIAKLIDGTYPEYRRVIPNNPHTTTINITNARKFLKVKNNRALLFEAGVMLTDSNSKVIYKDGITTSDGYIATINAAYLDLLATDMFNITYDKVNIEHDVNKPAAPITINGNIVLMPMRPNCRWVKGDAVINKNPHDESWTYQELKGEWV